MKSKIDRSGSCGSYKGTTGAVSTGLAGGTSGDPGRGLAEAKIIDFESNGTGAWIGGLKSGRCGARIKAAAGVGGLSSFGDIRDDLRSVVVVGNRDCEPEIGRKPFCG